VPPSNANPAVAGGAARPSGVVVLVPEAAAAAARALCEPAADATAGLATVAGAACGGGAGGADGIDGVLNNEAMITQSFVVNED
jgi:hypothetical protein